MIMDSDSSTQKTLDEILEIAFISVTTLIYLLFIIFMLRLLRKQHQKLDSLMTASLTLFGLSVIFSVVSVIFDMNDYKKEPCLAQLELFQVGQDMERIAIFLDIYRLIILVVALKSQEHEIVDRIKKCQRILIVWLLAFLIIMIYRYLEIYEDFKDQ